VLNDTSGFERGVRDTINWVSFGKALHTITGTFVLIKNDRREYQAASLRDDHTSSRWPSQSHLIGHFGKWADRSQLSAHQFASKEGGQFYLPWYQGELLHLSKDLGERLLPAFSTPTGIPFARVNLRHGVQKGESVETCQSVFGHVYGLHSAELCSGTAGAGSLILEFATLSRLTGDDRFEKAAHKAGCTLLRIVFVADSSLPGLLCAVEPSF
jgi:hypothetical protein